MNVTLTHRRTRWLLLCLMTMALAATAQPILSIPDTTGRKGDTLLIPLSLSGLGGDSLYSFQATVDLNSSHVAVIGVFTGGTLTAGGSASYFGATRKIAVAMTTPVTSSGTLLYLQVALVGTPGQQTTVGLSSVLLNEGAPTANVDAGVVRLRVVTLSPKNLSNVAEGDSVLFTATGDVVLPLAWTTSSASVGTIDGGGVFRAVTPGFVTVFVTDGEGKKDSTSAFTVVPNVIKSLTMWIPDTSRMQTLSVDVPVRVTTVTGLGITSAQFRVTFNTSALEYLGIISSGGMAAGWGVPTVNSLAPGTLDIAFAGSDTLTGAGTLVWLQFRVKPTAVGTTSIGLANASFNEAITPTLDAGAFTAIAAPLIKVNVSRTAALTGQTVTVVSVTGGTPPFTFSSSNAGIASVDPSTGTMSVLTRGAVLIQAVDAQGFPGKSDTIRTYDFEATVQDDSVFAGDSVIVPVVVGSTTGLGIQSFEFGMTLDTSKVMFRGISSTGTLSDGWSVDVRDSSGRIRVAAAGVTALSGSGVLLGIRLAASSALTNPDSVVVVLSDLRLNEPGGATPLALPVAGVLKLTIPNAATAPTFASVLDLAVPGVEYRRRVNRNGTPPTTVTAITLPSGASLVGDTLVWTPTDLQLGFRRVVLEASNVAGTVRDTTDILVEAVRSAQNQIRVDLTNRGKLGAFGNFGKGIWYQGKSGGGAGDFSLVDRNSLKFAGGLYSTLFSFRPDGPATSSIGFIDTTSRIPGFTAFRASFSDEWEPPATRIGVQIRMLGYFKNSAPDDHYVIVEYNVVNASGSPIDDLFAQMTADFDVGNAAADLGGYDATRGLSYAFEQGGGSDASYYGLALLSHPAAGHAVFLGGSDPQYVRSVANLTSFPAIPGAAGDTRNQLTAGPFALATGDTLRFGVAFLAADNLLQLQAAAQQARSVWGNITTSVTMGDRSVPATFDAVQNFPNPFNPSTVIRFSLPMESRVSVTVFDPLGREVSALVNGTLSAGVHEARWDASGMASGLYFYRIEAVGADGERFARTNKMVLMK